MHPPDEPLAGLPTIHLLRSALVAASVCDAACVETAIVHQSYLRLPTGGLYHCEDLVKGERLLLLCGLLTSHGTVLYPSEQLRALRGLPPDEASQILLALAAQQSPPLWLHSAVRDDAVWSELISDGDEQVLCEVIPDPEQREAFLLALANRFQSDTARQSGELGECAVVDRSRQELTQAGRGDLATLVQRVSLISDQLGYDVVAPTLHGRPRRIEVKTTGRASQTHFEVYLSRNEAAVALRDPSWALVLCQACDSSRAEVIGWCRAEAFSAVLPSDQHPKGRWTQVRLQLDSGALKEGLPPYE
jgi:uncharacterized protein DUF3883